MIRGLYSAATALDSGAQHQEVIAHNLAHANVPGHRRRGLAFETFDRALAEASPERAGDVLGTRIANAYNAFEPGPFAATGNPLDLAIEGEGFFVLQGPNGPLYTRDGAFTLNAQGSLQSRDGRVVLGTGGPITLPTTTATISVLPDGTVQADNTTVGRLQLARFPDASVLQPVGTTLFEARPGAAPQASTGVIRQGYREASNVQVVTEMVSMIAIARHHEAAQRALRAISEAVEQHTRPQSA